MKKHIIIILCLAFLSLACLTSAAAVAGTERPTEMATRVEEAATVIERRAEILPTGTTSPKLCARVEALKTLYLRKMGSTSAEVVGVLRNGEELQLLGDVGAAWWHVKQGEVSGFAKAEYLIKAECVK